MPKRDEYKPVRTGWKRSEELDDDELEQRGRIGLIVTALVILFLIVVSYWRGFF